MSQKIRNIICTHNNPTENAEEYLGRIFKELGAKFVIG